MTSHRRSPFRSVPWALLAAALLGAPLPPQAPPPQRDFEDLLPASTYATLRFGGLEACGVATDAMAMTGLVHAFLDRLPAATRQQFLDPGIEQATSEVQRALQRAALRPEDLRAVLARPMTIALGRLTVEGMGPSVTLLIDRGNAGPALDRLLDRLWRVLPAYGPPVDAGIAGGDIQLRQAENMPPLFAGNLGSLVVLGNSRGYLRELAQAAQGRTAALASLPAFAAARHQLGQPALASLFVNTRSVSAAMAPHLPYEATELSDALGVGALDGVYLGMAGGPGGGAGLLHIGLAGSTKGLCKALVAAPVDLQLASMCSKNAVAFAAGSFDLPAVLDAARTLLPMLPGGIGEQVGRELHHALRRELGQLGTTPDDVDGTLRAFGSQLAMALSLERGAVPKPELLVLLAVRDRLRVAALLQRLEGLAAARGGMEWKTRRAGAHEIRYTALRAGDLQLSPSYVLLDGGLLLASDTAALVRALNQVGKPDSLAVAEDFAAMANGSRGASGVVHLRLFRAVELGWRSVETMLYPLLDQQADQIGFTSDALPDQEAMARALGVCSLAWHVDEHGISLRGAGPVGLAAAVAAVGKVADQILQRASARLY